MLDFNAVKFSPKINLFKKNKARKGGDGGQITIITEKLSGSGKIIADGGSGQIGGKRGKININSKTSSFIGTLSTKGGKVISGAEALD